MFPRFREQIGTALDLFVEFSTLGEYRLAAEAIPGASGAPAEALSQAPQLGGAAADALRAAVRHTVAGGATGATPVATPAARRLLRAADALGNAKRPTPPRTARTPHTATPLAPAAKAAHPPKPPHTAKTARTPLAPRCTGDRRRTAETPSRTRVRKGAPTAAEQLCLAV